MIKDEKFDAYRLILRNAKNRMARLNGSLGQHGQEISEWDLLFSALLRFEQETGRCVPEDVKKVISSRISLLFGSDIERLSQVGLAGVSGVELVSLIEVLCNRLVELAESMPDESPRVVGRYSFSSWMMDLCYALLKPVEGDVLAEFSNGTGDFCGYACGRNKSVRALDIQLTSHEAQCKSADVRTALGALRAFVAGSQVKFVSGDVFDAIPEAPFPKIFIMPPLIGRTEHREMMKDNERRGKILKGVQRMNQNLALFKENDCLTDARCVDDIGMLMILQVIRAKMLLREDGTLVALVPRMIVDRGLLASLWRELISRGWLKSAVELPSGALPGTCIDAFLLVISEGNEDVILIDAKNMSRGGGLHGAEIVKIAKAVEGRVDETGFARKFSTRELLNCGKERKEVILSLSTIIDRERFAGFQGLRLNEVSVIFRGSGISPSEYNVDKEGLDVASELPILDIKSMVQDGDWGTRLPASQWSPRHYLRSDCINAMGKRLKFVEEGDIILPRLGTGKSFRPYLAQGIQAGVRWVIGPNLICIRPDKAKILPQFLNLYLEDSSFSDQLMSICGRSSSMIMVSPIDLGFVRIPNTDLNGQAEKISYIEQRRDIISDLKVKIAKHERELADVWRH